MINVPQDVIDDAVEAGLIPQPSRFLDAAYFEKIGKFAQLRAQRSNAEPVAWLVDGRIEQGLFFDKQAAEVMADANCGVVVPLYTPSAIEAAVNAKLEEAALIAEAYREVTDGQSMYIADKIRALMESPQPPQEQKS